MMVAPFSCWALIQFNTTGSSVRFMAGTITKIRAVRVLCIEVRNRRLRVRSESRVQLTGPVFVLSAKTSATSARLRIPNGIR